MADNEVTLTGTVHRVPQPFGALSNSLLRRLNLLVEAPHRTEDRGILEARRQVLNVIVKQSDIQPNDVRVRVGMHVCVHGELGTCWVTVPTKRRRDVVPRVLVRLHAHSVQLVDPDMPIAKRAQAETRSSPGDQYMVGFHSHDRAS